MNSQEQKTMTFCPNDFDNKFFDIFVFCRFKNTKNVSNVKKADIQEILDHLVKLDNKNYYFTIENPKLFDKFLNCTKKNKDICQLVDSKNKTPCDTNELLKKVRLLFTWENILTFGTPQQQKYFNIFRHAYISFLLNSVCITENYCKYATIGTPATSPQSDMDFDLSGSGISDIIKKISDIHMNYFTQSLDILFDVNLYGTVFNFEPYETLTEFPNKKDNERQKMWSFVRFVESVTMLKDERFFGFFEKLSIKDKKTFNYALHCVKNNFQNNNTNNNSQTNIKMLPKLSSVKSLDLYADNLGRYFKSAENNTADNFSNVMEMFSKTKFYENETYRTLGSVLHIVQKKRNLLIKDFYLHSVYDNFGFVAENLLHHKLCGNLFEPSVYKISKYIARICDALFLYDENVYENDHGIKDLFAASNKLNEARRSNNSNTRKLKEAYYEFLDNLDFSIFENNTHDNLDDNTRLLIKIYEKLLKNIM